MSKVGKLANAEWDQPVCDRVCIGEIVAGPFKSEGGAPCRLVSADKMHQTGWGQRIGLKPGIGAMNETEIRRCAPADVA